MANKSKSDRLMWKEGDLQVYKSVEDFKKASKTSKTSTAKKGAKKSGKNK